MDELFELHNEIIRDICENEVIKKTIKPIGQDMESYLVKKPTPGAELVESIVNEIRQIAGLETEMLGR